MEITQLNMVKISLRRIMYRIKETENQGVLASDLKIEEIEAKHEKA